MEEEKILKRIEDILSNTFVYGNGKLNDNCAESIMKMLNHLKNLSRIYGDVEPLYRKLLNIIREISIKMGPEVPPTFYAFGIRMLSELLMPVPRIGEDVLREIMITLHNCIMRYLEEFDGNCQNFLKDYIIILRIYPSYELLAILYTPKEGKGVVSVTITLSKDYM